MAKISKVGIANLKTIQADHVLNIIQALDGTDTTDIVISGSASLVGGATGSRFETTNDYYVNGIGLKNRVDALEAATSSFGYWTGSNGELTRYSNVKITGSLNVSEDINANSISASSQVHTPYLTVGIDSSSTFIYSLISVSNDNSVPVLGVRNYSTSNTAGPVIYTHRTLGRPGARGGLSSSISYILADFDFNSQVNSSAYNRSARILVKTTGSHGFSRVPGMFEFYTADDSSAVLALTINNNQLVTTHKGLYTENLSFISSTTARKANRFSTDTTLSGSSDTSLVSENAIKTYVDTIAAPLESSASIWTQTGTSVKLNSSANYVGINNSSPSYNLDLSGSFKLGEHYRYTDYTYNSESKYQGAGWYRIGYINSIGSTRFKVSTQGNNTFSLINFDVMAGAFGTGNSVLVHPSLRYGSGPIQKIRIGASGSSPVYVDLYIDGNMKNDLKVSVQDAGNAIGQKSYYDSFSFNPNIPYQDVVTVDVLSTLNSHKILLHSSETAGGGFVGGRGTTSHAVYAFSGSEDTGLYSPELDHVGILTAGTKRVTISSYGQTITGSLGVSSDIVSSGSLNVKDYLKAGGSTTKANAHSITGSVSISGRASQIISAIPSGTEAYIKLHNDQFSESLIGYTAISQDSGGQTNIANTRDDSDGRINFRVGGGGRLITPLSIFRGGKIGINWTGSLSPTALMHVSASTSVPGINIDSVGNKRHISFGMDTSNVKILFNSGSNFIIGSQPHGDRTSTSTNVTNRLVIQGSDGNVGIGTSSPGYKLDLSGTFRVSSYSYLAAVAIGTTSSPGANALWVNGDLAITSGYRIIMDKGAGNSNLIYSASHLCIRAATSPIISIESAGDGSLYLGKGNGSYNDGNIYVDGTTGHVGINSVVNPTVELEVLGTISASSDVHIAGVSVGNRLTKVEATASLVYPTWRGSNGNIYTYSPTSSMYISSSGNVGIGTAKPRAKLHIYSQTSGSSVFLVEGQYGELFQIFDEVSGSLLSISDVSGLPIFEVFDTDKVVMGSFGANTLVVTGSKVGIGTATPTVALDIVGSITASGDIGAVGNIYGAAKLFDIPHPTKEGKRLRHGSLEGPEHSVYVRGRLYNNNRIELPDYWKTLVHEDSVTVQLTPIGESKGLYVVYADTQEILIGSSDYTIIDCYYFVQAERKDIPKLEVER